jgi:DNA-binding LacI/PurR family transcriptional regulator
MRCSRRMPATRPTQKQIAELAGVHVSTVCLALSDHPSLPETTRQRIQAIARSIGYEPDPMLSALAAYRNSKRPPVFRGQLAWLSGDRGGWDWRSIPVSKAYIKGATECASARGYTLSDFWIDREDMTPRRAAEILVARNVLGLLIPPQAVPETELDFQWDRFSAVAIGETLAKPRLHVVGFNHFGSTQTIYRQLSNLGYRRIGLALPQDLDERVGGYISGGYLREQNVHPAKSHVPVFRPRPGKSVRPEFSGWLRRHRPDALITTNYLFPELLNDLGIRVPDDLGVAVVFKKIDGDDFAGVEQDSHLIGKVAVDFLVAMIQRHERGVPVVAQRVFVEGRWVMGRTVRRIRKIPGA